MTACDGTARENDVEFETVNDAHVGITIAYLSSMVIVSPCYSTSLQKKESSTMNEGKCTTLYQNMKDVITIHENSQVGEMSHTLPQEILDLYLMSQGRAFSIERVVFRNARDIYKNSTGSIVFADEVVTCTTTKQWMYQPIDDLIASTVGESFTTHVFLQRLARREYHQRAQNHLRYTEKCVNGRYVPSPELVRPCSPGDHPVD